MNIIDLSKTIQRAVGVTADGVLGPVSLTAIARKLGAIPDDWPEPLGPTLVEDSDKVDERSEGVIATLLPQVRPYARALIHKCAEQGISIKAISGTRTYREQDELYAEGRTESGHIVTNARGGYSNHNFGLAFDIGLFQGSAYVPESPVYKAVGAIGKSIGLSWGGYWSSIQDEPHFELRPSWADGLSESAMLAGLRQRHEDGRSAFEA